MIVVDDCSTKHTGELENLKKEFQNVEWYSTEKNGGGGKARNIGLEKAKGKYIIFADADDYFLPEFNNILDHYGKDHNRDLIFFNSISKFDDTDLPANRTRRVNDYFLQYKKNPTKSSNLLKYSFGEPWGKIINYGIIKNNNIQFDETPIHNDTKFSYLIGFHSKSVDVYPINGYCVTDRISSTSKNINWKNLNYKADIFSKKAMFFKENDITTFDPIIFTPFLIAVSKLEFNKFNDFYKTYRQHKLSTTDIVLGMIKSSWFYLSNNFLGLISKYRKI